MNLDATINEVGFEIANLLDKNDIEKLLGVLAQDGVYAMWVYALNKTEEEKLLNLLLQLSILPIEVIDESNIKIKLEKIQEQIELFSKINELKKEIKDLKNELKQNQENQAKKEELIQKRQELEIKKNEYKILFQKNYDFFKTLSTDLNQLLFFKELLEKALIYARYHAKAMSDE